jgi:hypothetical protein
MFTSRNERLYITVCRFSIKVRFLNINKRIIKYELYDNDVAK